MKKVMFLMMAAIIFGSGVFAQEGDFEDFEDDDVKQPRFLIGGNVAFDYDYMESAQKNGINGRSTEFINSIDFHFKPYFGYFINNKLIIGIKLGLNYYENTYAYPHTMLDYNDDPTTFGITDGNSFEIAPFLRFQDTLVGKFRYYVDFCLGTEFSGDMNAVNYFTTYDYEMNFYYASVDVGLMYLLSKRTGIEFKLAGVELGARFEKLYDNEDSWPTDYEAKSFSVDFFSDFLQPNLGVVVNF